MDSLIVDMVKNAPSLIGLAVAVLILYRQVDRLLTETFERMDKLEEKIDRLENRVVWQKTDSPTAQK